MMIRDQYTQLSSSPVNATSIEAMKKFRDRCITEQNHEYYYFANLKLIDYYIELSLYEEGLLLANHDLPDLDPTVFRYIYVSYLERLIYLNVQKRNFRMAYRYVFQKRQFIDEGNRDSINRWYLEMAYIYAELNQKTKALQHLQAIVENLPSDEILSHALSNMTKLYIDEHMVDEAETTLNRCLTVTFDAEGRTYCHYLYALICILRGKTSDALVLFHEIFELGIEEHYVNMAFDYLELLIQLKKTSAADALIQSMKPLVLKNPTLETKKIFSILSLKASLLKTPNRDADALIEQLQQLTAEEEATRNLFLLEALEDEKTAVIHEQVSTLYTHLERLVQLLPMVSQETDIRSLLMDFGQKLSMVIDVDEIHFGLYQSILSEKPLTSIQSYYYKNKRLYEKTISFEQLKNTIIETLLIHHQEVFIDFNGYSVPIINIGTGKTYQEQGITSLFALPFNEEESMFFSVTYGAKYTDLGNSEHRLLLRMASMLLETKIRLFFNQEQERFLLFKQSSLEHASMCHILVHHEQGIILDEALQQQLFLPQSMISVSEFALGMSKKQQAAYEQVDFTKEQILHYSLGTEEVILYSEQIIPYPGDPHMAIGLLCQENAALDQELQFQEAMMAIQEKMQSIEYKFSFIRLKGNIKEYQMLESHFGVPIYFLDTEEYVIILENETNQKTLEKLIKGYEGRLSVIRFPRDMINLEEIIRFSKIGLEEGMTFFTDEVYQRYLKRGTIRSLVTNALANSFELWFRQVKLQDVVKGYEVHPRIHGVSEKEFVRFFLSPDLLDQYDGQLLKQVLLLDSDWDYYIPLSIPTIQSDAFMQSKNANKHIHVMIYEYVPYLLDLISKLNAKSVQVLLHYRLLDQLSVFDLQKLRLEGIIIDEGLEKEKRTHLLEIATTNNWVIYANYQFLDYHQCLIRTADLTKEL